MGPSSNSDVRSKLEAVIFDWGNTLVDYPLQEWASQLAFLNEHLLPAIRALAPGTGDCEFPPDWFHAFNAERPDHRFLEFSSRVKVLVLGMTREEAVRIEETFCERIFASGKPFAGFVEVIERIRDAGLRVAILSNLPWGTSGGLWKREVGRILGRLADEIPFVCCNDVGYRKPHRAPFIRCIEVLGCDPSRTLMVGDNYHSDIVGAMDSGLHAALVNYKHAVGRLNVSQFHSLDELASSIIQ